MGFTPHHLAKPYLNPNIHHTHHKRDRPKDKDNWRRDDFQPRVCCVKDHCPLARIGDHPTCCDQFALNYGRTYMPLAVGKYSYLPTFPLRCDEGKIGKTGRRRIALYIITRPFQKSVFRLASNSEKVKTFAINLCVGPILCGTRGSSRIVVIIHLKVSTSGNDRLWVPSGQLERGHLPTPDF